MIYITVPVTSKNLLIEFLGNQLSDALWDVVSSDLDDGLVEAHKDLVFASQQALNAFRRSEGLTTCPG